jgi:hypothetical protein
MAKNTKVEAASKSLNKSIGEIEKVLAGLPLPSTNSVLRRKLRSQISQLAQYWFGRGFRRGCIETHEVMKQPKKIKIAYDARRDFFDGRKRPVSVTWKAR